MKNETVKLLGIIAGVVLIGALSLVLVRNFGGANNQEDSLVKMLKPKSQLTDLSSTDSAEIVIKDLILREIEKREGLQVLINAQEGKIVHSDDKIECSKIKCLLSGKKGEIANLSANKAIISKSSKDIFLEGEAVVCFNEISMLGRDIFYNYSSQILNTKKQTRYNHANFFVLAEQSSIDVKKNTISMSGGVKSEILNRPACNGCCN